MLISKAFLPLKLAKIEQRQLVGFGQTFQKSQIRHQVDDRLTELAPLTEIIFGEERSLSCRFHESIGCLVTQSVDGGQGRHKFPVDDLKFMGICPVNVDLHKLKAAGIHFLYTLHILQRLLFFLG